MNDSKLKNNKIDKNNIATVDAVRTSDGFIEIVSLELLDDMVGGMINPEAILCQLHEDDVIKNVATGGM